MVLHGGGIQIWFHNPINFDKISNSTGKDVAQHYGRASTMFHTHCVSTSSTHTDEELNQKFKICNHPSIIQVATEPISDEASVKSW